MKLIKHIVALAASLGLHGAVLAQAATPHVDQQQINQERRIDQGIASGSLTQHEANRLERGQQHVDNVEARAKADGVVTRKERARMNQAQNVQSRHIARQKHDRQRRQ